MFSIQKVSISSYLAFLTRECVVPVCHSSNVVQPWPPEGHTFLGPSVGNVIRGFNSLVSPIPRLTNYRVVQVVVLPVVCIYVLILDVYPLET